MPETPSPAKLAGFVSKPRLNPTLLPANAGFKNQRLGLHNEDNFKMNAATVFVALSPATRGLSGNGYFPVMAD